jgi:hypothetical protein
LKSEENRVPVIKIPAFLLRRLYVKASLKNTQDGFEFELKNSLGTGYAKGILPLKVDGRELPLERSYFLVDGKEFPFSSISEQTPMTLAMNKATKVASHGGPLPPGSHKVVMGFVVVGLGEMSFDFTDSVS